MSACQLLSLLRRREAKLSDLVSVMSRYPQVLVNITVSNEGKLRFYTDIRVRQAIDDAKKQLGDRGRIVVRPSGTEPLLRVMVEAQTDELCEECVLHIINAMKGVQA